MIRSINSIGKFIKMTCTPRNSLDVVRKSHYWSNRSGQQQLNSDGKDRENINQESSRALQQKSIFSYPQKRNGSDTAVENISPKVPVPTK